jgi:hypothetical protein
VARAGLDEVLPPGVRWEVAPLSWVDQPWRGQQTACQPGEGDTHPGGVACILAVLTKAGTGAHDGPRDLADRSTNLRIDHPHVVRGVWAGACLCFCLTGGVSINGYYDLIRVASRVLEGDLAMRISRTTATGAAVAMSAWAQTVSATPA